MTAHFDSELLQRLGAGERLAPDAIREAHLAECARCSEAVAGWRRLCTGLGALETPDPGPDFTAAVLAGLDAPAVAAEPVLPMKTWALGIFAACLAAGVLAFFGAGVLADFPALVARGAASIGTTLVAAMAVLDGLAGAIPQGASAGLLVLEALFFLALARIMLRFSPLPQLEDSSR